MKGGAVESVLSIPQEDGSLLVSVAGFDWIEEWLVVDGRRVLVASVRLDVR